MGVGRQGLPSGRCLDVTPDLADKLHITVPSDRAILADVEKYRTELIDTCLEMDDEAMEAYLTAWTAPVGRRAAQVPAQGHRAAPRSPPCCAALPTRTRACSRCSMPWSTICRRRPTCRHQDRRRRRRTHRRAQVLGRRAVLGAGVQGHQRCLRRADLRPRVLGRAHQGRLGAELHARQAREDRPHGRDVRQGSQSRSRRRAPATSSRSSRWRKPRPAIRCAIPRIRWCSSACASRTP